MMIKKGFAATTAAVFLAGIMSSGAMAFNDLEGVAQAEKIIQLRDRGVVNGMNKDIFAPYEKLSAQQAIPLIVKSMQLSLAKFQFIKQPLASDTFTKIPDDEWYAEAFVIAHVNGVPIDKDIHPNEPVTREQFVHWLMSALYTTGDYAFIEIFMMLEDEKNVSEGYMDSIQKAVITGIAELPDDSKFRPQIPITRAEAAVMARNAIQFIEDQPQAAPELPIRNPIETGEVTTSTEAVNRDVQKITMSMGEKPHPGWSIRIEGIDFIRENSAVIHYSVTYPDPAALYPMVITYPKAETYLDASMTNIQYELVAVHDTIPDPDAPTSNGDGTPSHPKEDVYSTE